MLPFMMKSFNFFLNKHGGTLIRSRDGFKGGEVERPPGFMRFKDQKKYKILTLFTLLEVIINTSGDKKKKSLPRRDTDLDCY